MVARHAWEAHRELGALDGGGGALVDDDPAPLHPEGGTRLQAALAHAAARHHPAAAVPATPMGGTSGIS